MSDDDHQSSRKPDFFIVGAPKCGTTSLHRWLVGHPQVFMPVRPKEPHYFGADLRAGTGMLFPDDLGAYLALFDSDAARAARRAGEASTTYLEEPDAPARIGAFNPGARIVVMLRDPVEMIASLHSMRVSQGLERMTDLRDALADERSRPGFGIVGDQSSVRYRDRVRFTVTLPRWFEVFGRERVHVIVLDDVAADPAREFRSILEFLDVDPSYSPPTFERYNEREWPRSLLLARLQARLRRPWTRNGPRDRLVRRGYHLLGRANRVRGVRKQMTTDVRNQLREEFSPEVEELSRLLERDLTKLWWGERA